MAAPSSTRQHVRVLLMRSWWIRRSDWPSTACQLLLPALLVMTVGLIAISSRQVTQNPGNNQYCQYGQCGTIYNYTGNYFGGANARGKASLSPQPPNFDPSILPLHDFAWFLVGGYGDQVGTDTYGSATTVSAQSMPVEQSVGEGILGYVNRYSGIWNSSSVQPPKPIDWNNKSQPLWLPFTRGPNSAGMSGSFTPETLDDAFAAIERDLLEIASKSTANSSDGSYNLYSSQVYAEEARSMLPTAGLLVRQNAVSNMLEYTLQVFPGYYESSLNYLYIANRPSSTTTWLAPAVPQLVNMLHTAAWRQQTGNITRSIAGSMSPFPFYIGAGSNSLFDNSAIVLGHFLYPLAFSLLLPSLVFLLVLEKQEKQRELMAMMGMRDAAYWIANALADFLLWLVVVVLCVVVGAACQVAPFNSVGSAFAAIALLLSWAPQMSVLADLWSVFVGKNRTIVTLLLYVLVLGFASGMGTLNLLSEPANSSDASEEYPWGWIFIIPSTGFFRGFGLALEGRVAEALGVPFLVLWVHTLVLVALFWYLHLVVPQSVGVHKSPLFFLSFLRSRYGREGYQQVNERTKLVRELKHASRLSGDYREDADEDVDAEEQRVLSKDGPTALFDTESQAGMVNFVVLKNLVKQYDGTHERAVDGVTLALPSGECFGLLGPNGSGKTTIISMLTGLFEPTSGSASILGHDVVTDSVQARRSVGVCPQFDVQWPKLSVRQHIAFYAALRGLNSSTHVEQIARQVGLFEHLNKKSKELSGGMQRRLSVAMAISGNPSVVVLDEPTTGLDVASRRQLWSVLDTYRQARNATFLLTTHSMEEANSLCSRVAIIAKGKLRAIGSPTHLKAKFGTGCSFTVTYTQGLEAEGDAAVQRAFAKLLHLEVQADSSRSAPSADGSAVAARLTSSVASTFTYRITSSDVKVSKLMAELAPLSRAASADTDHRAKVGLSADNSSDGDDGSVALIEDWSLTHATLEDVFLAVCSDLSGKGRTKGKARSPGGWSSKGEVDTTGQSIDDVEACSIDENVLNPRDHVTNRAGPSAQLRALLSKSAMQAWRRRTWCIALVPLFGCAVLALSVLIARLSGSGDVLHPDAGWPKMPRCGDFVSDSHQDGAQSQSVMTSPCITLAWAPSGSVFARRSVEAVVATLEIPSHEIAEFASEKAMTNASLISPRRYLFGLAIAPADDVQAQYSLYVNLNVSSTWTARVNANQPLGSIGSMLNALSQQWSTPWPMLLPLQAAVDSALTGIKFSPQLKSMPLVLDSSANAEGILTPLLAGFLFTLAPALIGFAFLFQVMTEKDLKLRQGLEIIGVRAPMYWGVSILVALIFIAAATLLQIGAGAAFGFAVFASGRVDLSVTFVVFFTFAVALVALFFSLGACCRSRALANGCAAFILIGNAAIGVTFASKMLVGFFLDASLDVGVLEAIRTILLALLPTMPFVRIFADMSAAAGVVDYANPAMSQIASNNTAMYYTWHNMTQTSAPNSLGGDDQHLVVSGLGALGVMCMQILLFAVLGWYADNVLYYGRPVYFPILLPGRIIEARRYRRHRSALKAAKLAAKSVPASATGEGGDDVVAADRRRALDQYDTNNSDPACALVNVVHLSKSYSSTWRTLIRDRSFALSDICLPVDGGQVFCLLGHNGAGKTTLFHILNGVLEPTAGTAEFVLRQMRSNSASAFDPGLPERARHIQGPGNSKAVGSDIRFDLADIRPAIGLCPQHDILWPELSAREHLEFFAAVKGVPRSAVRQLANQLLSSVELEDVAENKAGTFSGGMKRRLSVAVAVIGSPSLVFLDEPTTGTDPGVKRSLWELISELKRRSTVILTTHSLEEAEALADRISIMAGGRIKATGTSLRLKRAYGSGIQLHITCVADDDIPVGDGNGDDFNDDERRVAPPAPRIPAAQQQLPEDWAARSILDFVSSHCPSARLCSNNAGNMRFSAPRDDPAFVSLCSQLENDRTRPRAVREWSVSESSLEEVFISVGAE